MKFIHMMSVIDKMGPVTVNKVARHISHLCNMCQGKDKSCYRIQFHYSQTESSDAVRSEITFFFFTVWRIFIFYDFFATTEVYKAQIL